MFPFCGVERCGIREWRIEGAETVMEFEVQVHGYGA